MHVHDWTEDGVQITTLKVDSPAKDAVYKCEVRSGVFPESQVGSCKALLTVTMQGLNYL